MSTDDESIQDPGARVPSAPPDTGAEKQALLDQLRGANEQLVASSRRAQELADDAQAPRAEAVAANWSRDEVLAVVSHELRNPLNAVLGWARLLSDGKIDATRTVDAIRAIERNAKAMARIIDDLLDVSRVIGGNIRIESQPVDLVAVIQGAIDEMHPVAQAKAQRLTFTCAATPDPVIGDAMRLQQVVSNLLSNAIKFTPSGGSVDVTLASADSCAEIRVTDTGQGIAAAFLPNIFDRFSQADSSTTRRQGGLGLGLAIVRALVQRHGGTVRAESPGPGLGATLSVRLPVLSAQDVSDVGPRPIRDTTTALDRPARLDGIRILLVDDDDDGRTMLTTLLELAGASVAPAGSVREALAVLDAARPDVIVSDVGMPNEDGFVLIRHVRTRAVEGGGRVPAIALTGYVRAEDRARLLAAGFQHHLRKPIESREILAAIAALATTGGQ